MSCAPLDVQRSSLSVPVSFHVSEMSKGSFRGSVAQPPPAVAVPRPTTIVAPSIQPIVIPESAFFRGLDVRFPFDRNQV